jgi:hypothetical protein
MSVRTELEAILAEAGVTITREQAQSIAHAVVARKSLVTMSAAVDRVEEVHEDVDALRMDDARLEMLQFAIDSEKRLSDRMIANAGDAHRIANLAMSVGLAECDRLRAELAKTTKWLDGFDLSATYMAKSMHELHEILQVPEGVSTTIGAQAMVYRAIAAEREVVRLQDLLGERGDDLAEAKEDAEIAKAEARDLRARVKDMEVQLMHRPPASTEGVTTYDELRETFFSTIAMAASPSNAMPKALHAVAEKVRAERKPCPLTEALRLGCDVSIREVTDETRPRGILWRVDVDGAQQAREVREPEDVMGAIAEQVAEVKVTRMGRS